MRRRPGRDAAARGFTLVEMMTSVAIVGLILLLIGYEFDASIASLIHTRSNRDDESNSRVVMTKVVNRLRTASPWVLGQPSPAPSSSPGADPVILLPVPVSAPSVAASTLLQHPP